MGAMYKLKAYFGMVPAEELEEYSDEPAHDRYAVSRRPERDAREYVGERSAERWDDRFPRESGGPRDSYDDEWDRRPARPAGVDRPVSAASRELSREPIRGGSGFGPTAVRGALAMDTDALHRERALREPARPPVPTAVPEQRERPVPAASALSRITTLHPQSYKEAREIGERYREGIPVIMNLTELDAADAKRLVDFAAGLVFALRGGFDKVTNRVFLLTPADIEVSADDARRLAQRGRPGPG
jgi:cell division inhibitor SepF